MTSGVYRTKVESSTKGYRTKVDSRTKGYRTNAGPQNCINSQKEMVFVRQRRLAGKSPTARHLVPHCGEGAPNSAEYAPAQCTGNLGHRHYWEQGFYDTKRVPVVRSDSTGTI